MPFAQDLDLLPLVDPADCYQESKNPKDERLIFKKLGAWLGSREPYVRGIDESL